MKKYIKCLSLILALLMTFSLVGCHKEYEKVNPNLTVSNKELKDYDVPEYHIKSVSKSLISHANVNMNFTADKDSKLLFKLGEDNMKSVYIAGVNMGLSTGTTNLANINISYDTYMTWFSKIAQMNANTVRVFSIMPPQFYKAFYDYNKDASKKLYLMQGVWFNEDYMSDPGDCYKGEVIEEFERNVTKAVDVIHGNAEYIRYSNNDSDKFIYDVSEYTLGYILGLEWSNEFVTASNKHKDKESFSGNYLKTGDTSRPFEAFLARIGNTLISHESETYNFQTPVAFLNWSTNDTLNHPNEPDSYEDSVEVNTESIVATSNYYAGLFAAVDVYPYYPKSIDYDTKYNTYKDDLTGKQNNYKAYLEDLKKEYTVPLLVAEFGVSTSRGCAAESVLSYNQGGNTEQQQGLYDSKMIVDIASSGCAGGLIFSWQDEWFKQIWNTFRYSDCAPEQRTPNRMVPEQNYGILAVEAGEKTACILDGKTDDWQDSDILFDTSDYSLSVKYDEAYLYGYINLKKGKLGENKLVIPVSTVGIGSKKANDFGLKFNKKADSLIVIDGKDNSAVMSDEYYDYNRFRFYPEEKKTADSGKYNIVTQFVNGELQLPQTNETIERKSNEVGKLNFGTSDPDSDDFNSLSDFYAESNVVEFRIPWYMLGVLNISQGMALNNFNKENEAYAVELKNISLGISFANQSDEVKLENMKYKTGNSTYHTRLKKSYDYIQKTLATLFTQ